MIADARSVSRFLVVGLTNTLLNLAIFTLAMRVLPGSPLGYTLAQLACYTPGVLWSYFWNRRWSFESARDTGAPEIWLDRTATTFFDCRGVRVLRDLRAGLLEGRRRLVLICPLGPVRRLLVLTGADREFEIHSTAAAATRPWRAGVARETRGGPHRQR